MWCLSEIWSIISSSAVSQVSQHKRISATFLSTITVTTTMSKHHPGNVPIFSGTRSQSNTNFIDLIMCRRQPGIGESSILAALRNEPQTDTEATAAIGRLCEKCDGKWYVFRPNLSSYQYAEPLAKAPYATHTSAQKHSADLRRM